MSYVVNAIESTRIARFGRGGAIVRSQHAPLDDDTMRRAAPSIFADEKHESRSERYTFIPTVAVLEGMRKEGFLPFEVRQGGSSDAGKRLKTKHMIRFRKQGVVMRDVGDSMREVVLLNSHDGSSRYELLSGVFRMICSNGMVVADGKAESVRIPHRGDIVRDVIDAAYTIIDDGARVDRQIADMRAVTLSRPEQEIFAEAALIARFGDDRPALEPRQILQPRRTADLGDNVWQTFNRAQENLTHGGLAYVTRDERGRVRQHRHTRPVNSIDGDTNLNRALWTLAARMAELKA